MTRRLASFLLASTFAALAAGCSGEEGGAPLDGGGGSDGGGGAGGPLTSGIAIVSSDYMTTVVSLVDPRVPVLATDDCIDSGTKAPMLSQVLSGDVVLPSQPTLAHTLLLVDRSNAVLTWLDPGKCTVRAQLSVKTGFKSNPRDVVSVTASKSYVLRYDANPTPTADAADFDEGDDLLVIDPELPKITGRIDLGPYATKPGVLARPDRGMWIDGKVYLTLANLSDGYKDAGEGRILIVDPAADSVSGMIDLPGLKGCQGLSYIEATKTLLCACGGAFSDGAMQAAGSALVTIDLDAAKPAVKRTYPASSFGGRAISAGYVAGLGAAAAYVVTAGEFSGPPPDQLWAVDLSSGAATMVESASAGFVYNGLLVDPARKRLYLTDAAMKTPRLDTYDLTTATMPLRSTAFDANPAQMLPPREIGWF